MRDPDTGQPPEDETVHPRPGQAAVLAATPKRPKPVPDRLRPKHPRRRSIAGHGIELPTRAGLFALASGSKEVDTGCGEGGFEFLAVVVLVRDQGGTGDLVGQVSVVEDAQQHVAFIGFGAGDRGRDRQPVQRAQQVQPQAPE